MKRVLLLIGLCFVSCELPITPQPIAKATGWIVLCEGLFQKNNSVISYYNRETKEVTQDIFEQKNAQKLGDTGNDMIQYGGKIYAVVNGSGKVEVVDSKTFRRQKFISFLEGGKNKNPRNIIGANGKVFVSSWDSTVTVIDTSSLAIEKSILLTLSYPEKMVMASGKLFVSAAGDYANDYMGSGVAVIDIAALKQKSIINAGKNMGDMAVDKRQNVYAVSRGGYDASFMYLVEPRLVVISSESGSVTETFPFDVLEVEVSGDNLYAVTREKNAKDEYVNQVLLYDLGAKKVVSQKFIDVVASGITSLYRITALGDDVFLSDAKDFQVQGEVFVFDKRGEKQYAFKVGINPSLVLGVSLK